MSARYHLGRSGVAFFAVAALVTGCKEPAGGTPEDLAKIAESSKPAPPPSESAPPAAASAPPAAPPPLTPQLFKAEKPSALCAPVKSQTCALDMFGGAPATDSLAVERTVTAPFVGWAADGDTLTVQPVVIVALKGAKKTFYAPAVRQTKRADVAESLKAPALVDAGFDLLGDFKDVEPGTYDIQVLTVGSTGAAYSCETRRQLKVE